jgi:hypothetical protein
VAPRLPRLRIGRASEPSTVEVEVADASTMGGPSLGGMHAQDVLAWSAWAILACHARALTN